MNFTKLEYKDHNGILQINFIARKAFWLALLALISLSILLFIQVFSGERTLGMNASAQGLFLSIAWILLLKSASFGSLSVNRLKSKISWKHGLAGFNKGECSVDDYDNFTYQELSGLGDKTYRIGLIKNNKTKWISPYFQCADAEFEKLMEILSQDI